MKPRKENVLVAEDDSNSRFLITSILKQNAFSSVHVAADGKEAMALLHGEAEFDLAILDVMMPHHSGVEVLELIRRLKRTRNTKVVMLTAVGEEEIVQRCVELGAQNYILKPFSAAELMERVAVALAQPAAADDATAEPLAPGVA